MRVGYNWLKDYVDLDVSARDLAEMLTMAGLEVEELHDRYAYLDRVLVGRVTRIEPHPRADKLKICQVETGTDSFQVVCGAPNMVEGMLSALALTGAELPGGAVVGETDIRGIKSSGMLCSEAELLVGPDASTIMDLSGRSQVGQKLQDALALADWVFEIGITPNRPDCLSVLGVAREAAGLLRKELRYPEFRIEESGLHVEEVTSIRVEDTDFCPRYTARVIRGVDIGPSPFWMVDRLAAAGVRSINNIVDITNFVMMELGQPLHAFDMDRLEEQRIVVKLAQEGDRFTTLDNVERIMGPEMLMICDGARAVGLAGVMGGLNSEIEEDTKNVLLESAYFNPAATRKTSRNLGLSTEASYRFERGVDPEGCDLAANRSVALMKDLAGGEILPGVIDVYPVPHQRIHIGFSPKKCNEFLGTVFTEDEMAECLESIDLKVNGAGDARVVTVPGFRVDLTREVDIFEEVARLMGYANVPTTLPGALVEPEPVDPSWGVRALTRDVLVGLGISEIICYSFTHENFPDKLGLPEDDERRRTVPILNPLSEEQALLRTTLAPGMLEVLRRNQSHGVWDVRLFEIGRIFFERQDEELPEEKLMVAGLLSGNREGLSWHHKPAVVDFYDIKGVVEELLESLNLPEPVFEKAGPPSFFDSSATARVSVGDRVLGWVGRLNPRVVKAFELRNTGRDMPYYFELDMAAMLAVIKGTPQNSSLPKYPSVSRDFAMILDRDIEALKIKQYLEELQEEYLVDIVLFDVYEGDRLGPGKRSLAFRLVYRSSDRTLTDEEVNTAHERVMNRTLEEFSATLPA